jgi:hypothetical protein
VKKLIIGNASSSGSTLLSDILDSTPFSACGQEIELFHNRHLYRGTLDPKASSPTASLYNRRSHIRLDRIHGYGMNESEFTRMLTQSSDFSSFVDWFASYYLSLRGKAEPWLFVEKTPVNIHAIREVLSLDESYNFLFMVRDPLFAASSMRKRGRSWYASYGTWLTTAATYLPFKDHPRVMLLRYEDFIESPFETVRGIVARLLGKDISSDDLAQAYEQNSYRRFRSHKVATWSVKDYGSISNANDRAVSDDEIKAFYGFRHASVSEPYARKFSIAPISFADALQEFGYGGRLESDNTEYPTLQKTAQDFRSLLKRFLADLRLGDAKLAELGTYLNPVTLGNHDV